jgi:serralysin
MGNPLILTWGFSAPNTLINDTAFSHFPTGINELQVRLNSIYGSQDVWQPIFQSVFDRWSAISGLTFQHEAADDGASYIVNSFVSPQGRLGVRADIRIGGKALDGDNGMVAYSFYPSSADMVLDTGDAFFEDTSDDSLRLRYTVAHELGHGLGLEHVESSDQALLMEGYLNSGIDGPQYHDILMVQRGYGDAYEKTNGGLGNDTVGNATPLGALGVGELLALGQDARSLAVTASTTSFVSIDDATDTDFYSFTVTSAGNLTVSLEALGFTYNATGEGLGGSVPFNAAQRSDLRLSLFDTDGTTLLASVDSTGLGGTELLSSFFLAGSGTYYLSIQGTNNPDALDTDTQFYGLSLGLTRIGALSVTAPEPGAGTLVALGAALLWGAIRRRRHSLVL